MLEEDINISPNYFANQQVPSPRGSVGAENENNNNESMSESDSLLENAPTVPLQRPRSAQRREELQGRVERTLLKLVKQLKMDENSVNSGSDSDENNNQSSFAGGSFLLRNILKTPGVQRSGRSTDHVSRDAITFPSARRVDKPRTQKTLGELFKGFHKFSGPDRNKSSDFRRWLLQLEDVLRSISDPEAIINASDVVLPVSDQQLKDDPSIL